ncbi:hypothetical protein V1264_013346 [Littorina saxatilis]
MRQEVARITVEMERKQDMLRRLNKRYKHAKRTVFPLKYYMLKRLVRLAANELTMPDRQGWGGLAENNRDIVRLQDLKEGLRIRRRDRNWLDQALGERQTTLNELNRLRQDIKQLYTESRQMPMRDRYIMLKQRVKRVVIKYRGLVIDANGHLMIQPAGEG